MIISFANQGTEDLYHGKRTTKARKILPKDLFKVAIRKLEMLEAAHILEDLRVPPGNRLEKLSGNLNGCHSIRINNQYRIVFKWTDLGPKDVKIVDYH